MTQYPKEQHLYPEDYTKFVDETCDYRDPIYPVLGLAGETGEFVELVKKAWRKEGLEWVASVDSTKAQSELGDIVWYVTRIASFFGLTLNDLVTYNMKKLTERRANGK